MMQQFVYSVCQTDTCIIMKPINVFLRPTIQYSRKAFIDKGIDKMCSVFELKTDTLAVYTKTAVLKTHLKSFFMIGNASDYSVMSTVI